MNYDDPKLVDLLAAEYVLGTLSGRARSRFQKLASSRPKVRDRVEYWDQRLNQLAQGAQPAPPPPGAWEQIFARVSPLPATQPVRSILEQISFWRRAAFTGGLVALVLAVVLAWPVAEQATVNGEYVVLLRDQAERAIWTINTDANRAMLQVRKTGELPMPDGMACYLWLDMGEAKRPELLGKLPDAGMEEIEVPMELRPMLPGRLLVSVEAVTGPPPNDMPRPLGIDSEWMRPVRGA